MVMGADPGDGGIASDSDDGGAASSMPGDLDDAASSMPGDLDDCDEHEDFVLRPQLDDDTACSEGCWEAEKDDRDSCYGGAYGLLLANWGGKWSDEVYRLICFMT